MPKWESEQTAALERAVSLVAEAGPIVLLIEGEAGMGKSTLLDELRRMTGSLMTFAADCLESDRVPYGVLRQWGIDPPMVTGQASPNPFVSAQLLRDRIDQPSDDAPVLLIVDDLHWADPESVETLTWVLRRAAGDRLLVAVTSRPLAPDQHEMWQRWAERSPSVHHVRLTGLSEEAAVDVVQQRHPGLSTEAARRLWAHTDGSPLYLSALLDEHSAGELTDVPVLPAPGTYANSVAARVCELSAPDQDLLHALAVLGTGWATLLDAAEVADVSDVAGAADRLESAGLVVTRRDGRLGALRFAHALTHAAIYRQVSFQDRRRLHLRAAVIATTDEARLDHRIAATERYDDELATELETYAGRMYAQRSLRLATYYLNAAAQLSPTSTVRERRWLTARFLAVISHDLAAVHADSDIARANDAVRTGLVLGTLAAWERRYHQAIALLEPALAAAGGNPDHAGTADAADHALARYRLAVLLAWSQLCCGEPDDRITQSLAAADAAGSSDEVLDGLAMVTRGQLMVHRVGLERALAGFPELPRPVAATPREATGALAFRGSLRLRAGLFDDAITDLTEATARIEAGLSDLGAGSFHASLAMAYWTRGEWSEARRLFQLAFDISAPHTHPFVLVMAPVLDLVEGNAEAAAEVLGRAQTILEQAPWADACQMLFGARVIEAHASGSVRVQERLLTLARKSVMAPDEEPDAPLANVHLAMAAIWAQDTKCATAAIQRASRSMAPWAEAASQWMAGLQAERRGRGAEAHRLLQQATEKGLREIPLYQAHLLADTARVTYLMGEATSSRRFLDEAEGIYRHLGAQPYIRRLPAMHDSWTAPPSVSTAQPASADSGRFADLTDRERDVLHLLRSGLSYEQMARSLFITRRTVGYHLSNIYAKTGATSRHEVVELLRGSEATA